MIKSRRGDEYAGIEKRTSDRRSDCMAVPEKLCDEKHNFLERIINHRFEAMDAALVLRTIELERRLDALNHLRAERSQLVEKGTYDLRVSYYDKYIEDSRAVHQAIANRVTIIETRSIVWTSAIGIAFTLLQILLYFYPR